jgi:type IV secretion system protein VirD4
MQGTNVLFGQIAVVFGIVIAGVWGATQWTAAALNRPGFRGGRLV